MNLQSLEPLYEMCQNELNDMLESTLPEVDMVGIGEYLIECEDPNILVPLKRWLSIVQYIETDTELESVVSDDLYDTLHSLYKKLTNNSIVGTSTKSSTKITKQHNYPELRGSLDKVHFVYDFEKEDSNDTRESMESWINKVSNKCNISKIEFVDDLKYDGLSAVFEFTEFGRIDNVLTRKDTEANLGVVINHIFPENYMILGLKDLINTVGKCGVQCEILMSKPDYDKFCKVVSKPPNNRRSAVSMILNTSEEEYNPDWFNYLTVKPLKISMPEMIYFTEYELKELVKDYKMIPSDVYTFKSRKVYIFLDKTHSIHKCNIEKFLKYVYDSRKVYSALTDDDSNFDLLIDGFVISLTNSEVIETLGRSNNINKFQVAYKFPSGKKKTKIVSVDFPVGPVAGTITPRAQVEPIEIMGNKITNVSLSNCAKLKRLDINIGDEVIVTYDIIPTISKDNTCKKGNGTHINHPIHCPVCGSELYISEDLSTVRCVNQDCNTKIVGKILNYIKKLKIKGMGKSIIQSLVDKGIIKTIDDLYRLENHKETIINMDGYGETSFNSMIQAINNKKVLYPHELLGSLGIPDISKKTMEKVCNVYPFKELINMVRNEDRTDITLSFRLSDIYGIGTTTGVRIVNGIENNLELIDTLLHYITIKDYVSNNNDEGEVILFSKIRDKNFEKFLIDIGHTVVDNFNKSVTLLIVSDVNDTSTKITKAKNNGIPVISIDDAYKRFNY